MPRDARLVYPGRPHHVVLRGNNRRRLFSFASDYFRLLLFVAEALKAGGCVIHAIVIMSNHIHILVTPRDAQALADFVKSFAQRYAQYRNRRRGGSGKLFEQRFYSRWIEDDNHYGCTLAYIDDNPRRAGMVVSPAHYRWSSHHVYAATGRDAWRDAFLDIITPADWYLDLDSDAAGRQERYAEWVEDCHARARHPLHAEEIDRLELVSERYSRRLLRPDGSSAG